MTKYARLISEEIPQTEPLSDNQVRNNAGGFVFALDDWKRLDRFLILGSDASTYYQKAVALTRENAKCVTRCYDLAPGRTVARIVEISDSGRAPKNDAAIFALAMGATHANVSVRSAACKAMPKVCRTATHLFQFVDACRALGRGWGRAMKQAVAAWYNAKTAESVAFQAIKYRQREGYTHKRLLQTAHPHGDMTPARAELYNWICGKPFKVELLPSQVVAHLAVMSEGCPTPTIIKAVKDNNLPWEALPTEANKEPEVWKAMLPEMGLTALIRNLGNMSKIGAIKPLSDAEAMAVERISDTAAIRKARIHPFSILQAHAVYASGRGFRGKGAWPVSAPIVDALDSAFEKAFENVEPTGKRIFIGLDVSGSMSSPFADSPLMVSQAAAAMAMVTMRREAKWHVMGFADGLRDLGLSARQSLATVVNKTAGLTFGGTDCALPMQYAQAQGIEADVFIVITDNETWASSTHPAKALQSYRKKTGINAKLVVMGMTSTGFSIADPNDGGMLDVVGMDSAVPAVVAAFIKG